MLNDGMTEKPFDFGCGAAGFAEKPIERCLFFQKNLAFWTLVFRFSLYRFASRANEVGGPGRSNPHTISCHLNENMYLHMQLLCNF